LFSQVYFLYFFIIAYFTRFAYSLRDFRLHKVTVDRTNPYPEVTD